jgi:8-oxo-dGTP pyrophosphatase MutT (NUDIX family)
MKIGVAAVIQRWDPEARTRTVLLGRKRQDASLTHAGQWVFPGGGLEEGETIQKALNREVQEETALRVVFRRVLGVYTIVIHSRDESQTVVVILALCSPRSTTLAGLKAGDDVAEVRWVTPEDAFRLIRNGEVTPLAAQVLDQSGWLLDTPFAPNGDAEVGHVEYRRGMAA